MKCDNLIGTGVALVTPFDKSGSVDFESLGSIVEYIIAGGVEYMVALGTTAESATMSSEERRSVLRFVVDRVDGRMPIVAGLGGNNTAELLHELESYDTTGIDALLSVTPYYNRPSQNGLYAHYKALSESSPLPIMLYNVPPRTGVNMSAETTLRLAHDCSNIMGVKEASGNMTQMAYILRDRPENFKVYSGDDGLALYAVAMGAEGVISVAANAFPNEVATMIREAMSWNMADATNLHLSLLETCDALFSEGNPVGIKTALEVKGLCSRDVRLPLVGGSEQLYERLKKLME